MRLSNITSEYNRSLLRELVASEFKLRYQGSMFGYVWSLLKPLMLFVILYMVFTRFLRFGGDPKSLLLGIILWNFFIEATTMSLKSIVERGDIIRKIYFPKYLIVLASTFSALINLALNLLVVFTFVIIFGGNLSLDTLFFLPLIISELFIFTLAVSFFLAALFVRLRDINYIWEIGTQMLFFITPILYPLSFIPNVDVRALFMLNPLAQIIQDARQVFTSDVQQIYDFYDFPGYLIPFLIVLISIVIASQYFRKQSKYFAEDV